MSWFREKLFPTKFQGMLSVFLIILCAAVLYKALGWLVIDATVFGTATDCRAAGGACWAFILEKYQYILFGVYPREHLWRPIFGMFLVLVFWFHFTQKKNWNKLLFIKFPGIFLLYFFLLRGGVFSDVVKNHLWGGLPLTILLSGVGIMVAYPMGILLALGRRARSRFISFPVVAYIELIRGVPLISLLFMASVMLPLFLPAGVTFDKLLRAQLAIILFSAAYFAEVVRGGLQGISSGQEEAAKALGMNYVQIQSKIILPQALVKVIPPTVNTMIGMFKDTSLVIVIALFDLMGTAKSSLSDSSWLGFSLEAYIFIAGIYYIVCFAMGRFSKKVEEEFRLSKERV